MRAISLATLCFATLSSLAACGASSTKVDDPRWVELHERLGKVQRASCLAAPIHAMCESGLRAEIASPPAPGIKPRTVIVWCEDGRPHARFEGFGVDDVSGEFGQSYWEALFRGLAATDNCAHAYGQKIRVSRDGVVAACSDPRFDLESLFEYARRSARTGPPQKKAPEEESSGLHNICDIAPDACPKAPSVCPPFEGDPWNGAGEVDPTPRSKSVAPAPHEIDLDVESGGPVAPTRAPVDAAAPPPAGASAPARPSQGEITKAVGDLLPKARQCLPPEHGVSKAAIVFGSDGRVQSVKVQGFAAGKPAEACIQSALGRARVGSFASPSYVITVTVR